MRITVLGRCNRAKIKNDPWSKTGAQVYYINLYALYSYNSRIISVRGWPRVDTIIYIIYFINIYVHMGTCTANYNNILDGGHTSRFLSLPPHTPAPPHRFSRYELIDLVLWNDVCFFFKHI